jgi:hypothetical protein
MQMVSSLTDKQSSKWSQLFTDKVLAKKTIQLRPGDLTLTALCSAIGVRPDILGKSLKRSWGNPIVTVSRYAKTIAILIGWYGFSSLTGSYQGRLVKSVTCHRGDRYS